MYRFNLTLLALFLTACVGPIPWDPQAAREIAEQAITPTSQCQRVGSWVTAAPMPVARTSISAVALDGQIYVVGGVPAVTDSWGFSLLQRYNPATATWTTLANMPTGRINQAAVAIDGKLYVVGGRDISDRPLSILERYDPATNTWTRLADMPTARKFLAAVAIDGKLYAVGGSDPFVLPSLERYDPANNTWMRLADMPTRRTALAAVAIGSRLYAAGGWGVPESWRYIAPTFFGPPPAIFHLRDLEVYEPDRDPTRPGTWTTRRPMPTGRSDLAAVAMGGKLYVLGGLGPFGQLWTYPYWFGPESFLSTVEVYDPAIDSWCVAPSMSTGRVGLAAVELSGQIHAVGGTVMQGGRGTPSEVVERYP